MEPFKSVTLPRKESNTTNHPKGVQNLEDHVTHSSRHHSLKYIESRTDIRVSSTRPKSRDHEIVRAQKKVFKGHPNTPPKSYSVVRDPPV